MTVTDIAVSMISQTDSSCVMYQQQQQQWFHVCPACEWENGGVGVIKGLK